MPNLGQSMEFNVVLTSRAQLDFRNITHYLLYELKSEQATISVTNDMEQTIEQLSYMASGLKLCNDLRLRDLGYRTIHFKRHNYFMLYHIQNDTVYIDAIYHDLQNYEGNSE